MNSSIRPQCISLDSISLQVVGQETLLYDGRNHQAWCLNRISACVWHLCDGQKTVAQIAAAAAVEMGAEVTEDLVLLTVAELQDKNLLEPDSLMALPGGLSRRRMLSNAGLAAAVLLPVVSSVFAPSALAVGASGIVSGVKAQAAAE